MRNAELRLIQGGSTPPASRRFPRFNALHNMQECKSQRMPAGSPADHRLWPRQPRSACSPGGADPHRAAEVAASPHTGQPASPQRSPFPPSPAVNEWADNPNLYFSRYKSELLPMVTRVIHSHTHTHTRREEVVCCRKYRMSWHVFPLLSQRSGQLVASSADPGSLQGEES